MTASPLTISKLFMQVGLNHFPSGIGEGPWFAFCAYAAIISSLIFVANAADGMLPRAESVCRDCNPDSRWRSERGLRSASLTALRSAHRIVSAF